MIFLTKIISWGKGGRGDGVSDFFYYESKFKKIWGEFGGGATVGPE